MSSPIKVVEHLPLNELIKISKKVKSAKQKIRSPAIIWGYQSNFYPRVRDIANKLGVTRQTVYNWIKKWNKDGLNGILLKMQAERCPENTHGTRMLGINSRHLA
ncbi:MAG: helix-turn-helix domain-containing protein [Promethearchaeota archaeon]